MNINVVKEFPKGTRCVAIWIYKNKIQSELINNEGYVIDTKGNDTEDFWEERDICDSAEFIGYIILEE